MKRYMAVFTGSQASMDAWKSLDEAQRQQRERDGMAAWHLWGERHGAAIIDHGAPLGKTLRVGKDGIAATRNNLAAYTVVEAESHEAAAAMFKQHPHFTIFPGDGVEVMECLPIPGM